MTAPSPGPPLTLAALSTRRVVVWGLGGEGRAMARLLVKRGAPPVLVDDDPDTASGRIDRGLVAHTGPVLAPGRVQWGSVDVVVRSPGVSRYRPELLAVESAGVTITTSMAVWLTDFSDAPVLAITGTKGKSTTASLATAILRGQGCAAALAGNIGVPVADLYDRPRVDAYVVEVSSYQAADVTSAPRVAVLTSLAPDHLDWHGSEEQYYRDKLRLVKAGPPIAVAVNADNPEAVRRTEDLEHRVLFGSTGLVSVDGAGMVSVGGSPLVEAARLPLVGAHNVSNLCGALAGVTLLRGVPTRNAVATAMDGFEGLPSRCRVVGVKDRLTFVDDSLASNPFATMSSVASFPGRALTVILGGADRGVDPAGLADALAARRPSPTIIVVDPGWPSLVAALVASPSPSSPPPPSPSPLPLGAGAPQVRAVSTLEEAVAVASACTTAGGVVLFSPAAPTPPNEGTYQSRSLRFIAAAGLDPPGGRG